MSVLSDRIRAEREKRGWSQVFVANKLGMKRSSTYANWEYGIREPDTEMLSKLAELYEISIDYLTGHTDDPSPINKDGVQDLIDYLNNNPMLDGKPMPQELIDDIKGYIRIQKAAGKL